MGVYYIDSSSLAKRYKKEAGSDKIDQLFSDSSNQHLISNLTVVEIQSALASKVRTQEISSHEFMLLRRRFFSDINKKTLFVISLRNVNFQEAGKLIAKYGTTKQIRTLDALQLTIALDLIRGEILDYFVCSDHKLCTIAKNEDISVIDPEKA